MSEVGMVGALGTAGSVGLGAAAGLVGSAGGLGGANGANGLGPGTLELNAFNSYLGQTDVLGGKLVIGDSVRGNVNLTDQTWRMDKIGFELAYGDSFQVIDVGSYTGQVDRFDISQFEKLMRFPADLYDR